jgi:hypothetical protein
LYRNNSEKTNAEEILLGVDTYNYTGYFAGNANYSSSSTTQYLTISQGTPTLTLSSSPSWSPTDVQATTVTCSATSQNNEVSANLSRNGTDVNSTQNGIAQFYVVGVYNYTCNTTATTNYTTNLTSQIMTVTGTKGSVEGYITDSSGGSGIQGATVYITGYSGVATTSNGYYLITGIIPGTYTVTVDKSGYTSNSTSAIVTAGTTTQKNMTMVSTADTTAPNNPASITTVQVSGTKQINLTWSASTSNDTVRYNVYYKLGSAVTTSSNSFLIGNVTRTSIAVGSDGNWNFTVTAIDSSNNENTTIVTSVNITIDTTAPGVSSTSPNGTITDNTPTLVINTTESGYCKFDNLDKSMTSMAYTMTGSGTGHEYTLSTLIDGVYTYYIRCNDTTGNEMAVTSISFNLVTMTLYNLTRPNTIFGYWNANQWHDFLLPQLVLQNTTLATYNVTNVLASVAGNYTIIYYNPSDTSTTWTSYIPGVGGTLTTFNDQTGYRPYWIYTNVTNERLEIN